MDCASNARRSAVFTSGGVVEWHREKDFKYAAIKRIIQVMVGEQVSLHTHTHTRTHAHAHTHIKWIPTTETPKLPQNPT